MDTEQMSELDTQSSTEKGFNVNCITDVWRKGLSLLRSDGIKEKRRSERERNVRERKLMEVIGDYIVQSQQNKRNTSLEPEEEVEEVPDWLNECANMSRFG